MTKARAAVATVAVTLAAALVPAAAHATAVVTQTWTLANGKVTTSGAPGMDPIQEAVNTTSLPNGRERLTVRVYTKMPDFDPSNLKQAVLRYAASGASLQTEMAAVGLPTPPGAAVVPQTSGQPFNSGCMSETQDNGNAVGYVCLTQYLLGWSGKTAYIGDHIETYGNDSGAFNSLNVLEGYDHYGADNQIIQWSPTGTVSEGSCVTVSGSVSWGPFNFGASGEDCPNKVTPVLIPTAPNGFGVEWSGTDTNGDTVGATGVDMDKNWTLQATGKGTDNVGIGLTMSSGFHI